MLRFIKKEDIESSKEVQQLKNKFYRLMFELGLDNKYKDTFRLKVLNKTNYGYFAQVYLTDGVFFSDLEKSTDQIEQGLCCLWVMKREKFKNCAEVKIVTVPLDESNPFENPNIQPHQMYLGLSLSLKPIINDNNKNHHFLIAGATGSGKTRFLQMLLLSWIIGCDHNEVELYLSDIAKDEYINFQYVRHVKCYASELGELYKMMQYIKIQLKKRKKIISWYRDKGLATNIEEYNKFNPKMKMSYMYVMIDEFSIVMPDKSDNKSEKQTKEEILDTIKDVVKIGRSLGIFAIICTQKTVRDELPSVIKSMSGVRISFRANDAISSEVILGNNAAVGIADRYAIYSLNGGDKRDYLFSPNLSTARLNELLKPHIDKTHRKVNIEAEICSDKESEPIPCKVTPLPKKAIKEPKKSSPYPLIDTSKIKEDDIIDY